jgi:hypothetical protein
MIARSVNPAVRAGDPFFAARRADDAHHPHGCLNGVVYVGHMVEDPETGEEVEVIDRMPCRRCPQNS